MTDKAAGLNSYEARQERRRARLAAAAAKARKESVAAWEASRRATDGIPFGQPVLVGHHSEKRHRAALARSDRAIAKGVALAKKAAELAGRGASVGTGGISSDDPDAQAKLDDKRTTLEQQRDRMKAANAAWRKRDDAALIATTGMGLVYWTAEIEGRFSWEKQPYPASTLTNLNARIRATAKRADQIEAAGELEALDEVVGAGRLVVDPDDNRVTLVFPARLSKDDYKDVRSYGFVWSPARGGFTRKLSEAAVHHGRRLLEHLSASGASGVV